MKRFACEALSFELEEEAEELMERIVRQYAKYHCNIELSKWRWQEDRFMFKIKLKGNTRESNVRANAPDVQLKLKLSLFHVYKSDFTLAFIVSRKQIKYDTLPVLIERNKKFFSILCEMQLPYAIGFDALGRFVFVDLADLPHLLMGGASGSGKSIGLQVLIYSIICSHASTEVNFILIDVGATSLMAFENIPHLSCPIIQSRDKVFPALSALVAEMERRIALEHSKPIQYKLLPRIVLVIDEFPALFTGMQDKQDIRAIIDLISSLLQRGRHAKIHLVLAAQNPTFQNMKIDLSNITARIAFTCAKKNFSETILGESGAEQLSGNGQLLFKSPNRNELQQIQGAYINPEQLIPATNSALELRAPTVLGYHKFEMVFDSTTESGNDTSFRDICGNQTRSNNIENRWFAVMLAWVIEEGEISINKVMQEFRIGWNKAEKFVRKLEEWGIVENPKGKLPRRVIPTHFTELSDELQKFLQDNLTQDDVNYCCPFWSDSDHCGYI